MSYKLTTITTTTVNQKLSGTSPAVCAAVRVGGIANLISTITIRNGSALIDTIPVGATPGTEIRYYGAVFESGLAVKLGNGSDTAVVVWGPA